MAVADDLFVVVPSNVFAALLPAIPANPVPVAAAAAIVLEAVRFRPVANPFRLDVLGVPTVLSNISILL